MSCSELRGKWRIHNKMAVHEVVQRNGKAYGEDLTALVCGGVLTAGHQHVFLSVVKFSYAILLVFTMYNINAFVS
jgi:hypothetical protein